MKYEITAQRIEVKTEEAFSGSPVAVAKQFEVDNPGFKVQEVTELLGPEECGDTFSVVGHCIACESPVFDTERWTQDEEGGVVCTSCHPIKV